jgi:hypothetical protein
MENKFKPTAIVNNREWYNARLLSTEYQVEQAVKGAEALGQSYELFTAYDVLYQFDSEDEPPVDAIDLYKRLKRIETGVWIEGEI